MLECICIVLYVSEKYPQPSKQRFRNYFHLCMNALAKLSLRHKCFQFSAFPFIENRSLTEKKIMLQISYFSLFVFFLVWRWQSSSFLPSPLHLGAILFFLYIFPSHSSSSSQAKEPWGPDRITLSASQTMIKPKHARARTMMICSRESAMNFILSLLF